VESGSKTPSSRIALCCSIRLGKGKIKGPKQENQNLGARKPKGLNRIVKIKGSKQENQNQLM
jgi:hypothetical protein